MHLDSFVIFDCNYFMKIRREIEEELKYFQRTSPKAEKGYLIYSGNLKLDSKDYFVMNYNNAASIF